MSYGASSNPQRLGKYELRERLGRGGMAEVWKAFDSQLERYVAIKILHADLQSDPEFLTRFTREARVIASLHHPNIVQVHDFQVIRSPETNTPIAYMVMDYVEGQTLADYIRSTSRMGKFPPAADIVQLFASISRATDYAHHHGMIHRDIKPANILLDKRHTAHNPMGEPILSDFGIAKLLGVSTGTQSGNWLGTPTYISPEQALGHPGNERTDIYSLGVVLYEICTGVQPFHGESVSAILMQQINAMPTPPALINPSIPPALTMVIMRCLAKDPATRFSSAASMTAALAEALNVPIPPDMSQPLYPVDAMSGPTYLSSPQPNLPEGMERASPSSHMASVPISPSVANTTPEMVASPVDGQSRFRTPVNITPDAPRSANSIQNLQAIPSLPQSSKSPKGPMQRKRWRIGLIALLIIVLLGSSFAGLYWLTHKSSAIVTNQIVGHAFFVSSEQISDHSNQGLNDGLIIDLQNVPNPAPNKSYYAWLLGDENQQLASPILLGPLSVSGGKVHVVFKGDTHHTNLLGITSRFLITEENANIQPNNPSPDQSNWRYFAELPQKAVITTTPTSSMGTSAPSTSSMDMMNDTVLQHLRHLLADAPELTPLGLHGGLDIWLFRNTQKILEWAGSARDATDPSFIQRQVIRTLAYLDGVQYFGHDVPPGTPCLCQKPNSSVAVLEFDVQMQNPPGYLSQIGTHLNALTQAPDVTTEKRMLAAQIDQDINNMQGWLEQVHKDAKQLINTPLKLYNSPASRSLLDDMEANALYAFIGRPDPSTGKVLGGMIQVHYNIQDLATYDVSPYSSH
ncbi:MAG TPA: protein kinase [Ktedonobacteraceae bacterium]|nr:protein kinase [Ktedonobacteraceae bacterium]